MVPKGQKTNINFKDMLNLAQNALSLSPLLLLVGKSTVSAPIGKETLLSVGSYSLLAFQLLTCDSCALPWGARVMVFY